MIKLSDYFTLDEMTVSQTASRNDIDNTPPAAIVETLTKTAKRMDHVRRLLGRPINVLSGYRSPEVNAAVGGSRTSSHMTGEAVDFICPNFGTPEQVFNKIKESGVDFDQLIVEFGRWVHIGFGPRMRRELLIAGRGPNGKTHYEKVT